LGGSTQAVWFSGRSLRESGSIIAAWLARSVCNQRLLTDPCDGLHSQIMGAFGKTLFSITTHDEIVSDSFIKP
jgi:hypothetical protein